jgi:hypothetical protein
MGKRRLAIFILIRCFLNLNLRLRAEEIHLVFGGWGMEDGGWRMEEDGLGVEDGGWWMEDGGWRMGE